MTAEERATGYCEVCHRRLRDPLSIARKKGRTCWKKTARVRKQIELDFKEGAASGTSDALQ